MGTVIHAARLVGSGCPEAGDAGWVRFENGEVAAIGSGALTPSAIAHGDEVIDASALASGATLVPGFVDIHGHGGAGFAHEDGPDAVIAARAAHRAHGTTSAVVSLVTADIDTLAARAAMIAGLVGPEHGVLGSHLEGPFLDPGHCGAHDPELLRDPAPDDVARLLDAGAGTVRQVTIAPERTGGYEAIAQIVAAGAVAAVGHTDADADATARAVDRGASVLTHAFNAMRGIHHRAPGPIPTAARDPRVTLELICDGVHVSPDVMRMLFLSAPGRVALITDAMAATGMPDGEYILGTLDVVVDQGVPRVRATGAIAGSTLTQDLALRNAVAFGVPLPDAVAALTSIPAAAVGAEGVGTLAPGARADAVLLDADLRVRAVWANGARAV